MAENTGIGSVGHSEARLSWVAFGLSVALLAGSIVLVCLTEDKSWFSTILTVSLLLIGTFFSRARWIREQRKSGYKLSEGTDGTSPERAIVLGVIGLYTIFGLAGILRWRFGDEFAIVKGSSMRDFFVGLVLLVPLTQAYVSKPGSLKAVKVNDINTCTHEGNEKECTREWKIFWKFRQCL